MSRFRVLEGGAKVYICGGVVTLKKGGKIKSGTKKRRKKKEENKRKKKKKKRRRRRRRRRKRKEKEKEEKKNDQKKDVTRKRPRDASIDSAAMQYGYQHIQNPRFGIHDDLPLKRGPYLHMSCVRYPYLWSKYIH